MGNPEKKLKPVFTSGGGQKRIQGKTLWNKDGMRYFWNAEEKWKEIYDSEDDMKILYNRWDKWMASKGKEIKVGDGTRKTFHYVLATWYDEETPELKETNANSEDEDGFVIGGGYSSDRGRSRHSIAWQRGQLRDEKMKGSEKSKNSDSDDDEIVDPKSLDRRSPPLFSAAAAGSSGSLVGNTRSGAMARRAVAEKEQKKRKK
jgi:hypothetical protein